MKNIFQRNENGIYYGCKMINGQRIVKSLRTRNYAEAKKKYKEIFDPIVNASTVEEVTASALAARKRIKKDVIKIDDIWTRYEAAQNRPDSGEKTLKWYTSIHNIFIRWLKENHPSIKDARRVSDRIAQEYAWHLDSRGLSSRTINAYVKGMRTIYETLFIDYTNPFRKENITRRKLDDFGSHQPFTIDQINSILLSFDKKDISSQLSFPDEMRVLFYIGAYTGLRQEDAVNLKISEVDYTKKIIRRKPLKTERTSPRIATIPICPKLEEQLKLAEEWKAEDNPCILPNIDFLYRNKGDVLSDEIKIVLEANGFICNVKPTEEMKRVRAIVKYSFHSFRSSFATIMAPHYSVSILAKMMADSERTLEEYYIDIDEDAVLKSFEGFPVPEKEDIAEEESEESKASDAIADKISSLLEGVSDEKRAELLEMMAKQVKGDS